MRSGHGGLVLSLMLILDYRNPTLEEQALARIHRIGQTREVTTVRFYVRNSFEEVKTFVRKTIGAMANALPASNGPPKRQKATCWRAALPSRRRTGRRYKPGWSPCKCFSNAV